MVGKSSSRGIFGVAQGPGAAAKHFPQGLTILYTTLKTLHNLHLHPLSAHPGPLLRRATPLPQIWALLTGSVALRTAALHAHYGPVVRLGPNHLSFTDVRAWRDIYGHRVASDTSQPPPPENPKSTVYYGILPSASPSILDAGRAEHAVLRRALAHGFSDRALRAQEGRVRRYVGAMVAKVAGYVREGGGEARLDLGRWYNWMVFDLVGDLVFAEGFGCLEREEYHPFVRMILVGLEMGGWVVALGYAGFGWMLRGAWVLGLGKAVEDLWEGVRVKLQRRMDEGGEVDDLFEGLMREREKLNIDMGRLQSNAAILVAAGSETTATVLSGVTYLLLCNPDVMEKLKLEVRSAFKSADEITLASANQLPYMLACLSEALRRYPPVPSNLVREVAEGGATIAGHFLPGKTMVECQPWSMNHSTSHWEDPWSFRPERFLHSEEGAFGSKDVTEALQDFSVGPRNCIGRNLAYAEMRLALANMVYAFDMKLADESRDWLKGQKTYPVWKRGPLFVHIKSAA
ncbi:cytochrome P450 ClCP1 [Lasiosphaeria hispida]|uniref:Cytochrome P450 ClCP1 n=1 Tax=Lasiosphaeria hispida TaxID=260671 RepID=A0AAJ0H5B2_9PEZI|nr:cytochrome P450 ClCP1 [Lasiosphaeria hispida]